MTKLLKPKKVRIITLFFIGLNLLWLLVWGVNLFTETLPTNVHNPFIGMFLPYIALFLFPFFDVYEPSQWWADTELMRPAIIFWLVTLMGLTFIFLRSK